MHKRKKVTYEIGDRIRNARLDQRLTQKGLTEKLQIDVSMLRRLESAKMKTINEDLLHRICNFLNVDISDIDNEIGSKVVSSRISSTIYTDLTALKLSKNFATDSETIAYILKMYFSERAINSVRLEIKEMIEEALLNTFVREIKNQKDSNRKLLSIIDAFENISNISVDDIVEKMSKDHEKKKFTKKY